MKTLIIYGTRNGSVRTVANKLKQGLEGQIDIIDSKETTVKDITGYNKVLIGSSIYFGQINKHVKEFINMHKPELLNKRLGVFILAGEKDKSKMERQLRNSITNDIYEKADLISVIGSEIKLEKYSWLVKLILKYGQGIKENYQDLKEDKIKEFVKLFK